VVRFWLDILRKWRLTINPSSCRDGYVEASPAILSKKHVFLSSKICLRIDVEGRIG
jgi:hypothetical protein